MQADIKTRDLLYRPRLLSWASHTHSKPSRRKLLKKKKKLPEEQWVPESIPVIWLTKQEGKSSFPSLVTPLFQKIRTQGTQQPAALKQSTVLFSNMMQFSKFNRSHDYRCQKHPDSAQLLCAQFPTCGIAPGAPQEQLRCCTTLLLQGMEVPRHMQSLPALISPSLWGWSSFQRCSQHLTKSPTVSWDAQTAKEELQKEQLEAALSSKQTKHLNEDASARQGF